MFRRLAAILIDSIIILLPVTPIFIYFVVIHNHMDDLLGMNDILRILIFISPIIIYQILCELLFKRSFGKMIMGLRIVSLDGGEIKLWQMLLRNVMRILDHGLFPGIFLILITKKRQRLGDLLAGTVVVSDDNK
ncbi:RDD family protein [Paenibacillus sp. NPDC058174]|uniref:RDD family protein n=1 Tax=Paenibacillus sp. NPDC058174 TaxID=3346366 RepID=UPI0036D75CB0